MKKSLSHLLFMALYFFLVFPLLSYGETVNTKSYKSGNYHFHFEYPSTYSLREGSRGAFVELLMPKQRVLLFQIYDFRELVGFCSCSDVVAYKAKTHCAAGGPDGTAYCLDEDVKKEAVKIAGRSGYQVHLIQTEEGSHPKTKTKMPMILYCLDISSGSNQKILEIYGTDDEINKGIIGTLKFH